MGNRVSNANKIAICIFSSSNIRIDNECVYALLIIVRITSSSFAL